MSTFLFSNHVIVMKSNNNIAFLLSFLKCRNVANMNHVVRTINVNNLFSILWFPKTMAELANTFCCVDKLNFTSSLFINFIFLLYLCWRNFIGIFFMDFINFTGSDMTSFTAHFTNSLHCRVGLSFC